MLYDLLTRKMYKKTWQKNLTKYYDILPTLKTNKKNNFLPWILLPSDLFAYNLIRNEFI